MRPLLAVIVAYLFGSIPFGYLIVRATKGSDIRHSGSGGTGATNVSRSAGKLAGVITLGLDVLKGAAAVVIARSIFEDQPVAAADWWISLAAIAVIAGHIFPIWLRFRGGKGVATAVGVFLVLAPAAVGCAGIVFIMIVGITRYVSLGSIVAAAILPLFVWLLNEFVQPVPNIQALMTAVIAGALLIIFAHRGNIGRLLSGNESKFR
jgi:glycerol-3-phosphate acyltransferase PlsY